MVVEGQVGQFDAHLNQMNNFLQHNTTFKQKDGSWKQCSVLTADQLCNIEPLAKKPKWKLAMMEANIDPYNLNPPALLNYLERLQS
jgi:hypothetical protein